MILQCECGGKVSTEAKSCPHCGKPGPFAPPPPPRPKLWPQIAISLLLTLAAILALLKLLN